MSPQSTRGRSEREQQEIDRAMATWTGWVALFTGCLFFASIVSNLFIFLQYNTAANAQVDTREQLRAVISNTANVIAIPDSLDLPGALVSVNPIFQNFGGTRTDRFRAFASLKYFDGAIPNNLDLSKPYLDFKAGETVIGPNSPYSGFAVSIAADDVKKAKDGAGQILYWGEAEYSDIFNKAISHHLRYCTQLKVSTAANGKLQI